MKAPKSWSMPLTAALVRFVDVAELIKSRSIADEVLCDLAWPTTFDAGAGPREQPHCYVAR